MKIWDGVQVLIVGAARQGTALAQYLAARGARVTLNDRSPAEMLREARQALQEVPVEWALGGHPISLLKGKDLVAVSGGIPLDLPLIQEARKRGIPLTNDSQLFLEAVPCPVIGITGSAGKTTTTTLVGRMLQAEVGPERTWVGGNIGNPLITDLDDMQPEDWVVMELSSFQLELMTASPHIAAILNITPNHLDRHGTMEKYTAAKSRILAFQDENDIAVLGREDPGAWDLAASVAGKLVSFGREKPPRDEEGTFLKDAQIAYWNGETSRAYVSRDKNLLLGSHNLLNVLAATAIAVQAGVSPESVTAALEGFTGVEHRLEFVRSWKGAKWYNDSIATAPERAIAALEAFEEPLVLLAGGRDKDLPWHDFARLIQRRVRHLIVFGEAREILLRALEAVAREENDQMVPLTRCDGLAEAVQTADRVAQDGDVVLLAPGGTSFDEFADFAERGDCFKKWVRELA